MWEIGFPKDGWFNISSAKAKNKYLTVTKIDNIHQLTMEIDGTVFSIQNQLNSTFIIIHFYF